LILYVESNFILELVLEQEQSQAVEELLLLAERKELILAAPAFALVEPIWTLENSKGSRELLIGLEKLRTEISRSSDKEHEQAQLQAMIATVRNLHSDRQYRLGLVTHRFVHNASLLPLNTESIQLSFNLERPLYLDPFDAIMLASILVDLKSPSKDESKVFASLDKKAFAANAVREHLGVHNCQHIPGFSDTLEFIRARIN
jgi:predicted nucleic acid-binding protein